MANAATPKPKFIAPNTAFGMINPGTTTLPPGVTTFHETPQKGPQDPADVAAANGTAASPAPDWYKAYFGQYNVPADVQGQLIDILKKYATDPSTAQSLATQYLRGTDWYKSTFPGFAEGVNNGVISDESGYRGYLNAVNNIYNQYLGRHVSGDEIAALLKEGVSPSTIANRFQGQAWVNANQNDVQYLAGAFGSGRLTPDQLTALGNENAGIDTAQGQLQQKILAKAQQIHQKLFQGSLATPGLSIGANGLSAPSLLGTANRQTPDVQS